MRNAVIIGLLVASPTSASASPVRVEVSPSHVVLGAEDEVTVTVRTGMGTDEGDLVLRSTAGTLSELEQVERGLFRARLARPQTSFPQLAVVTAADLSLLAAGDPPAIGQAVVSYSARIELDGTSEAGAKMQVSLGGRSYPEVVVAEDGTFSVPIEVQPGEQFATGVSRDRLGNRSTTEINLYLPEVQRAHAFIHPQPVVAGEEAWLFVTTVSYAGAPENRQGLRVSARAGTLGDSERVATGVQRFRYRAPESIDERGDAIIVEDRPRRSKREIAVELTPGVLTTVSTRGDRVLWDQSANVKLAGRDRYGNAVALVHVTLTADALKVTGAGTNLRVPPPGSEGTRVFEVVARDRTGEEARGQVAVTWHRPLPVVLSIRWSGAGEIVVESTPEVVARVELASFGAKVIPRRVDGPILRARVEAVSPEVRIVARDPVTGTSVWIGPR